MPELTQEALQQAFDGAALEHKKTVAELKTAVFDRIEAVEKKGYADPEAKEKIDRLFARVDELDAKLGAPSGAQRLDTKTIGNAFTDSPEYGEWKKRGFRKQDKMTVEIPGGFFSSEQKTPINTGGSTAGLGHSTPGVQNYVRLEDLIQLQRQQLRIRQLLRVRKLTTGNAFDWVKQSVATRNASPQTEAATKAESTITYTTASGTVKTVAHFIQTTRQVLDDVPWLRDDLDSELTYGLALKEETEILSGDNLGDHLNGLIPQATAYNQSNASGDTKLDILRHYILQARLAFYPVDGIVLNPRDIAAIDLLKTEEGGVNKGVYIVGDPRTGMQMMTIWGKPVIESDSIASGKALVGAFGLGALLIDRMQATIDISFEHSTNFTTNQATILAEERLGLAVIRADSFVYGNI